MMPNIRLVIVVAVAALLATTAAAQQLAADLPVPAPSSVPPLQSYGDGDAACLSWTDDCRTCARAGADVTCSNIGIACQPGKIRCTSRQDGKTSR
jgi:hypothetical protein